jgi:hypothetical protein
MATSSSYLTPPCRFANSIFENGFTNMDGCLASGTAPSLDLGDTYTISSPQFGYNPDNHKMRATVTLCTLINQGGQCITNTITFKP